MITLLKFTLPQDIEKKKGGAEAPLCSLRSELRIIGIGDYFT
jgi:hypothetical protein